VHLALPWLDVAVDDPGPGLASQLARATSKFAMATTAASHRAVLSADVCETAAPANGPVLPDADMTFQFVRGRTGVSQSTFGTADGSVATVDHLSGRIDLRLREAVFTAPYSTWSDLVAAPLAEHWRALGCFPLHTAAVKVGGVCTLLCGPSGSGKTSLSLALVAAGGVWRADDKVLLRSTAIGVEAVSLYANTNLPLSTIRYHPALRFALTRQPLDATNEKRPCDMVELTLPFDLSPFTPAVIVFPVIRQTPKSRWRRLRTDETVIRLSAESPASTVRERLRAQHDLIVQLARACPAWELAAGRDVLDAPGAVAAGFQEELAAR
jgi:hypothetical protein